MYKILLLATLFAAVQADGKAQYKFELEVHDPHGGGVQTRKEERNGDSTRGEYTINEKDGSKTRVQYTVYGHQHGEHHQQHHGHHEIYNYGEPGQSSSGYSQQQNSKGSSGSSSGLDLGPTHGSSSLESVGGSSGYKSSFGGSEGYSLGGASASLGYSSEVEKSAESHSSHLGSSGYKFGEGLSSANAGGYRYGGSGQSSLGYHSGRDYEALQKGHISGGGSGVSSQSLSFGGGSGQVSSHYSASSGSSSQTGLKSYESQSEQKDREGYSSLSYQTGEEIKFSASPAFSGYAEEYKQPMPYKPRYHRPQPMYHQAQTGQSYKPKYESGFKPIENGFYNSKSDVKYQQSLSGSATGSYKGSGEAKSYHNFITYESGKGGGYKQHQEGSYQGEYKGASHSLPAHHSFYRGEGYKAASEGSSYGAYQVKSKYPAPKPVYHFNSAPAVHEESKYESAGYDSGKGVYHYYETRQSNDGPKSGYKSYQPLPALSYDLSKGSGYNLAQGGYGSMKEEYGLQKEAYALSKGGYSMGGEATSTLKLHTHGASVETITKHIVPPKYHEGKY